MNTETKLISLKPIEAVVLAAGRSRRMGEPKLVLPWGDTTVLGAVIWALSEGGKGVGLQGILVVTGGHQPTVESLLERLSPPMPLRWTFNPDYEGEMIKSLQHGLNHLHPSTQAALVVLGDQPQILASTVHDLLKCYQGEGHPLIAPSYRMRRGHPWIVDRCLWGEILALGGTQTLRDFFVSQAQKVHYYLVDTPTVLKDLDTPQDYQREKPA